MTSVTDVAAKAIPVADATVDVLALLGDAARGLAACVNVNVPPVAVPLDRDFLHFIDRHDALGVCDENTMSLCGACRVSAALSVATEQQAPS